MRLPEYLKYTNYADGCEDAFEECEQEMFGETNGAQQRFPRGLNRSGFCVEGEELGSKNVYDTGLSEFENFTRVYLADRKVPQHCELFYFEVSTSWTCRDPDGRYQELNSRAEHDTGGCSARRHLICATIAQLGGYGECYLKTPYVSDTDSLPETGDVPIDSYSLEYEGALEIEEWRNKKYFVTVDTSAATGYTGINTIGVIVDRARLSVLFTENGKLLKDQGFEYEDAFNDKYSQLIPMIYTTECSKGCAINFGLFEDEPFKFDITGFCKHANALYNDSVLSSCHTDSVFLYGLTTIQKHIAQYGVGHFRPLSSISNNETRGRYANGQFYEPTEGSLFQVELMEKLMLALTDGSGADLRTVEECLDKIKTTNSLNKNLGEAEMAELRIRINVIRLTGLLESGNASVKQFKETLAKPEFKSMDPRLVRQLLTLLILPKNKIEEYIAAPCFPDSIKNCARPDLILRQVKDLLPPLDDDIFILYLEDLDNKLCDPRFHERRHFCFPTYPFSRYGFDEKKVNYEHWQKFR